MIKMKDSGIAWIGDIPSDWNIAPNKRVMQKSKIICDKYNNENVLSLTMNGVIVRDLENPTGKMPLTFDGYQYVQAGNLLMCLFDIDVTPRCVGVINNDGVTSPAYSQFKLLNDNYVRYYYYYYLYLDFTKELLHLAKNLRHSLTESQLGEIYVPVPPLETQHRIADYLDKKCAKIDAIITKQQTVIEKLKEYKLLTITEAVTKGLNSEIEMKDSGIVWIGKTPKNWKVMKLKYVFAQGTNGLKIGPFGSALRGKTLEDGEYKIYNQAHLIQNNFSLNRHFVSEETYTELKNYEVIPGDILFSMMGTIGKCCIMPEGYPKGIMDSHLLKTRLNDRILPEFFVYAYDKDYSNQVFPQLLYSSNGTIMNGLNSTVLKNIRIVIPPIEEQKKIVNYLDSFCSKIDSQITKKEKFIEKLQEYKKSLIYEVVTGKKEV